MEFVAIFGVHVSFVRMENSYLQKNSIIWYFKTFAVNNCRSEN
jgi:hypothetical protein